MFCTNSVTYLNHAVSYPSKIGKKINGQGQEKKVILYEGTQTQKDYVSYLAQSSDGKE